MYKFYIILLAVLFLTVCKCQIPDSGPTKSPCLQSCPEVYSPVCASDGKTYGNKCELEVAQCLFKNHVSGGPLRKLYDGECGKVTSSTALPTTVDKCSQIMCSTSYQPVCGRDGKTYSNKCILSIANCNNVKLGGKPVEVASVGACNPTTTPSAKTTATPKQCVFKGCPYLQPNVCGDDGKTYKCYNELVYKNCITQQNVSMAYLGACQVPTTAAPPTKPPTKLSYDPCKRYNSWFGCGWFGTGIYCGTDGNTYLDDCELYRVQCYKNTNLRVVHRGRCGLDTDICRRYNLGQCNGNPGVLCGSDNKTYDNECSLMKAQCYKDKSLVVDYRGKCGLNIVPCRMYNHKVCNEKSGPVCGSDGRKYMSECYLNFAQCYHAGSLVFSNKTAQCNPCTRYKQNQCSSAHVHYCGSTGQIYESDCDLLHHQCQDNAITLAYKGVCNKGWNPCQVYCSPATAKPGKWCAKEDDLLFPKTFVYKSQCEMYQQMCIHRRIGEMLKEVTCKSSSGGLINRIIG